MRERKYIKFRVDMYDDTKFKIIDMKPERDMIHYVWTRLVALAGKVNLEGELYLSKNIPYTIETLAIEFNRECEQIKLALEVFMELEMIECTKDNTYRVKNFAKHQNIKVKEKSKSNDNKEVVHMNKVQRKETLKGKIPDNNDEEAENIADKNEAKGDNTINCNTDNLGISNEGIGKVDDALENDIDNARNKDNTINSINKFENSVSIQLSSVVKKNSRRKKKGKSFDSIGEVENEDNYESCFIEGERVLGEGERAISAWSF